jgi:predicted RNA-binding protein with TRAM domain
MAYSSRGRGFRRGGFRPAPVEVGKEYEAEITEISRRGDAGVAKIEGFVVFVSDAKVGDRAKFVITKVGRRYATAELVKSKAEDDEEEDEDEEEE